MSELRSGSRQLNDELSRMYYEMTNPQEIEKRERKEARDKRTKVRKQNYGL